MQTRQTPRKSIKLPSRYFTGTGAPDDVLVTEISAGGCRFASTSPDLTIGARLQIEIAGTGPHHGTVKWAEKGEIGVTFLRNITEAELGEFQSSHIPAASAGLSEREFEPMTKTKPTRFC
ncbi:PilZ domain-containing protein [Erythrobacter insulae]|uniref:PilZ domain-containing protein n=1 Tax=Erythrobacter insulae TaxID=2584124 RepID=A0A547PAG4_9SPHN|nr:PilZ domain-containing protein [Erythrobacter insulae]TRD11138.1 PilZ domain-containing protein [Erythrobacter insulae]